MSKHKKRKEKEKGSERNLTLGLFPFTLAYTFISPDVDSFFGPPIQTEDQYLSKNPLCLKYCIGTSKIPSLMN